METKNNNKVLIILCIILGLLVLGLGGYFVYDKFLVSDTPEEKQKEDLDNKVKVLDKGTFKYDEYYSYGSLHVEGYATIIHIPACSAEDCMDEIEESDYVFFNITRVENDDFSKYLEDLSGNSFASGQSIGLGCLTDSIINYYNDSDDTGMKKYELTRSVSDTIMNSTKEKPIVLELERFLFTGGSGAPACYSHISKINLID